MSSSSNGNGYQPPAKNPKTILSVADRAEKYRKPNQPVRVPLEQIGFHVDNRGGQGICPFHVHNLASNIAERGTSTIQ